MINLPFERLVLAAAITLTLAGCATKSGMATQAPLPPVSVGVESANVPKAPDLSVTQVTASARYLWIGDKWPAVKAVLGKIDEDKLRAGTISLSRDRADHLLAELAQVTNQEVRSTVTASLALGRPGRCGIGNTDDVRSLREVPLMINGESITPKPEVLVELQIYPIEAKDWTIHLEVELAVTTLERFIGYKTEADAGLEAGSRLKLVETTSGFYKPVFATESTKADVQIVSGEVVLILSSSGDRLYFLTASAKPVVRPAKG